MRVQVASHSWAEPAAHYLLLLTLCLPLLTVNLGSFPPVWFDEGYKMNAARTLAEDGIYGTYTLDGHLPFDPGISSGPADIVPTAMSFLLLGAGVAQARAVFVTYAVLALCCLYELATLIYGRGPGLIAALAVMLVPPLGDTSFVLTGRQVLGEAPALALISAGLLLLARSWGRAAQGPALAAGLLIGLGLLSKTQVAIPLIPALGFIAFARARLRPAQTLHELTPTLVAVAIVASWSALGRALNDEATSRENAALLAEATSANLLTGLFGRTLGAGAWAIVATMLIASAVGAWRLWQAKARGEARWWIEALLVGVVVTYAGWFALLSVGWPRYGYAGLILALLLLGGATGAALRSALARPALRSAGATLIAALFIVGLTPALTPARNSSDAQRVARYIEVSLPVDAVIETWEWELDALGRHRSFHHPDQHQLFLAIRQFSHQHSAFSLPYDPLQANPDYLIIGRFGQWTGIYRPELVARDFALLTTIGGYRIYRRLDRMPSSPWQSSAR